MLLGTPAGDLRPGSGCRVELEVEGSGCRAELEGAELRMQSGA